MMVEQKFPPEMPKISRAGAISSTEIVAAYLRGLAQAGRGCTSNNGSIASACGLSAGQVRVAKSHLVGARRLVGRYPATWISIDGFKFGEASADPLANAKAILRRFYSTVCDARVVDEPTRAASGPITMMYVGHKRMTVEDAVKLADKLKEINS